MFGGIVMGFVAIKEDITDANKSSRRLQSSEERLSILTRLRRMRLSCLTKPETSLSGMKRPKNSLVCPGKVIGAICTTMLVPLSLREAYFRAFPRFNKRTGRSLSRTVELVGLRKGGRSFRWRSRSRSAVKGAWHSIVWS